MKITIRTQLLLIILFTYVRYGKSACNCRDRKCSIPLNCRSGFRLDDCNCCLVCAKEEGELCGGKNLEHGSCKRRMECVVRNRPGEGNQLAKNTVGRCEYTKCHQKRCMFGQTCTLINNIPMCVCPRCTEDLKTTPVCGKKNQKQYPNECSLRRDECLIGKKIGKIDGLCQDQKLIKVECNHKFIRVEVSKSYLAEADEQNYHFTLLDDSCKMLENETHIFKTFLPNECKTKNVRRTSSTRMFTNVIRTPTHLSHNEYENVYIPFKCEYTTELSLARDLNRISDSLLSHNINVSPIVNTLKRRRYSRSINSKLNVDVDYLEKYLVVMQAKILAKYNALLNPTFCYASPIEKSQQWMKYFFIRRGCPIENGVSILETESPFVKMTVPSIRFKTARYPGVVIRCRIRACFPRTPNDKPLCDPICPHSGFPRTRRRRDVTLSRTTNVEFDYEMVEGTRMS